MYTMKLVWNSDTTAMIYCLDVVADVHDFSVLGYKIRSENENIHLCEVDVCVCVCLVNCDDKIHILALCRTK